LDSCAPDPFYRKGESIADAVIDVRGVEEGLRLEYYIRLRAFRGARFDSNWRRIEFFWTNNAR
jgi:hypothetical protein